MKNIKYLAIVEWVKNRIEEQGLSIGDRFYSENELCDIHGVSRQTVRQALAVLERDNVLMRKRGSGTFVRSSSFATAFDYTTVGVISTYFSDYIFPGIVTGIERKLSSRNMTMQLAITHNLVAEESRAIRAMLDRNVSGLIIEPSKSALPNPNRELYEEIKSRSIPTVFFNAKYTW
ncbi:MAG: GntR family transcriptional regulator, partial [Clostridiales Family XIII bacterium]|nr:GntR family transcriptional regulator [Clostridiales Family XIII bacterium]